MAVDAPSKPLKPPPRWQISFLSDEIDKPHNGGSDPLVIKAIIGNYEVNHILVDTGSAVDLLTYRAYKSMGFKDDEMSPCAPIYAFGNTQISVKGVIQLPICLGDEQHVRNVLHSFVVVDRPSVYNAIIERPLMGVMDLVLAPSGLMAKFPTPTGVRIVRTDQSMA